MISEKRILELASKCEFTPKYYMYSEFPDTGEVDGVYFSVKEDGVLLQQCYMFEDGWESVSRNGSGVLDGYHPLPKPKINSDVLKTILRHVPKDEITKEFLAQLDIDMDSRGVYYLSRCFANDSLGLLEKSLSDKFVNLVDGDKLPDDIIELMEDENTVKAMASLYQWLCTNVGFCYLEEAFRDGGYRLKMEKIDD